MQRRLGGISTILILVALFLATPRDGQSQCFRLYKPACTEIGDYISGQVGDIVCDQSGSWWYRCCIALGSEFTSSELSACECSLGRPVVYCDKYRQDGTRESYTYICGGCKCTSCNSGPPCTCE